MRTMKILVIVGHPDTQSFCTSLAKIYLKGAKRSGARTRLLRLSELTFDPILHKGYKQVQKLEKDLLIAQKDILWADHLVFVYPVWWYSFPAILKGFIDRVILPGFAFKYTGPLRWNKYLKGKTAHLIMTTGGPAWYYKILGNPSKAAMKKTLGFCGVKTKKVTVIGNAAQINKKRAIKELAKVNTMGSKQI